MPTFAQHFKAGVTLAHAVYTIDQIYEDDKLDWDDAPAIGAFIGGELLLWGADLLEWRNVGKKPLYIIEGAILTGGAVSYAIGGRSGLVAYTDVVTGKVSPAEWYDVVAPAVRKKSGELQKKSEELQIRAVGWVDRRLMEGQHYLEREYREKKRQVETGWELLNKYGRWANPVHLPF